MTPTIQFIETSFKRFNKEYFNNSLVTPLFEICNTKCLLGQMCTLGYNKYKIRISKYWDRCELDFNNTIIHEMIHLYIRQNKIKDTRRHHGAVFNKIANEINRKGGWHIARTDSVDNVDLADKNKSKTFYVMIYETRTKGKYFSLCFNPKYINKYKERLEFNDKAFIFTSTDTKQWAKYPTCYKGLRGWYISEDRANEIFNENKNTLLHCKGFVKQVA